MDRSWASLPLLKPVKDAIIDLKYKQMTPVQAACIPLMFNYKDVAAEAVTGSGKTVAFLVPVIQLLLKKEIPLKKYEIGALIISPTRELACQIHEVLQKFLKYCPRITSQVLVGGKNITGDLKNYIVNGCNVIVATPGKLESILEFKVDDGPTMSGGLKALEILILDEADKLLEMGFAPTLNTIISYLPKLRRTSIFSATQTDDVVNLIRAGMRNPVQITVKDNPSSSLRTPQSLQNYYMICEPDKKISILVSFLQKKITKKVMVFFSSCASVEYFSIVLSEILKKKKFLSLHGKIKSKRFSIFDQFRAIEGGVLLCTDVMCRGVDIPEVDWVVQFDPPSSAASFVHRCGRTARNGQIGRALLFLLPNELAYVNFIQINQKVSLKPLKTLENTPDLLEKMRQLQLKDRAVMDRAKKAYVSYMQGYVKHECHLIINVKHLNFGLLANGFGLLSLPRMPELRNYDGGEFIPHDIDLNLVKYKDKTKEKERLKNLATYKETGVWPSLKKKKKETVTWSEKIEQKEKKSKRKRKMEITKAKNAFTTEELKDLGDDFRMLRQYKKGKLSDEAYEKYMGLADEDSS